MVDHINQVIDKFIPLGAVRAEVMYYGMPCWWNNRLNTNWEGILIASGYLSDRYNVDIRSLMGDDKVAKKLDPGQSLDMALLDYARSILTSVDWAQERYIFFRPTQSIVGLFNQRALTVTSSVPLGIIPEFCEFNSFASQIYEAELRTEDEVFLERVLSVSHY